MTPSGIQLFQLLKPNLGDRATEALIDFVDTKAKENKHEMQEFNLKTLATKADLLAVKEDLWSVKEELKSNVLKVKEDLWKAKGELKKEISDVKIDISKLDTKISDVRSDMSRWMLAIFVTLILAFFGLYFKH